MIPVCDVIPPRRAPRVTLGLILALSIGFALQLAAPREVRFQLLETLALVPVRFTWTMLLTGPLLHTGWMHFGGNVLGLWIFGQTVEDSLGRPAYLVLCVAASAVAGLVYEALDPASAVPLAGAGGAVAGVLGAYFARYPRSQVLAVVWLRRFDVVEVPAAFLLAAWVAVQLVPTIAAAPSATADVNTLPGYAAAFAAGVVAGLLCPTKRRWE